MKTRHTRETLTDDLKNLGVELGDTLFIHSSFKSLGPVEGGAGTVISALEDTVGREGLILMPSFNLVEGRDMRARTWNVETTPSTVGWLTEAFRQMPDTYRSDHYSHSVAARGKGAKAFVDTHLSREGYNSPWDREPWGKTYGTHSPMQKAYQNGGKLLMIGVDYHTSTYVHFVEVLYWDELLKQNPGTPYPALDRPRLGAFWDEAGSLKHGLLGNASCRLFRIQQYIRTLLREVNGNPAPYLRPRA